MQEKSLILIKQVQEVIESYNFALTLRQIYYQLVAKQIIPNEQRYYAKLSRLCVIGRDEGLLPEEAFADRLREIDKPASWIDLKDFMETVKNAYKKDMWINQDDYLEIWTEKDALRGVIDPITHDFDVSLLVVRGQVSRTAIYESSNRFTKKMNENKKCHLFYFGDFDPSGISIYNSLANRLLDFNIDIDYERIALTPKQIKIYNLPQDPAKQSDPNYKSFVNKYGDNVVELDSLPPDILRNLVKECIESRIDFQVLKKIKQVEARESSKLKKFITGIDKTLTPRR